MVFLLGLFSFFSPLWAADAGWIENLEDAMKQAKASHKAILVDFTGSDWCGWCKKLKKEVFSKEKFKTEAPKNFILVELDFPRRKPQTDAVKKYNRDLQKKYGVRGFPTIFLMDENGVVFAKTGYQAGGVDNYLSHLKELSQIRTARDSLLQNEKTRTANSEGELALLDKALGTLFKNRKNERVSTSHPKLVEKNLLRILSLDGDNKKGLKKKYSIITVRYYAKKKNQAKVNQYLEEVKKLAPKEYDNLNIQLVELPKILSKLKSRTQRPTPKDFAEISKKLQNLMKKNPTGEAAQMVYYYAGAIEFQALKNKEKGRGFLTKAYQFAPNSTMGKRLKRILQKIK